MYVNVNDMTGPFFKMYILLKHTA